MLVEMTDNNIQYTVSILFLHFSFVRVVITTVSGYVNRAPNSASSPYRTFQSVLTSKQHKYPLSLTAQIGVKYI